MKFYIMEIIKIISIVWVLFGFGVGGYSLFLKGHLNLLEVLYIIIFHGALGFGIWALADKMNK